jgi:hypothetical protein
MSTKKTQLTRIELKFFIQKGMEIKKKDEHDDKKQRCTVTYVNKENPV